MGMVVAEPAFNSGVDAIRTYLANIGYSRSATGGIQKPGGLYNSYAPNAGTAVASDWALVLGHNYYGRSTNLVLEDSQADAAAACKAWNNGYNCSSCTEIPGGLSAISCGSGVLNGASGIYYGNFYYPNNGTYAGEMTENPVPPPVPATITDLTGKIQADLAVPVAAATAAADEAEDILHKGVPFAGNAAAAPPVADGTSSPPPAGVVVDTTIPATPTTGATTPGAEAVNVATAGLPSSGAITSTPPAAGTSQATTQDQPYTDPSYSGSFTSVPWATPSDFAARWSTFASGVQSTGLFGLWGSAFGSPGSGGGSTYTFNAGSLGTHTYDFSSWGSTVFGLLSGLIQITCGFVAVKIATVKGG
jgi:hypothetical protein